MKTTAPTKQREIKLLIDELIKANTPRQKLAILDVLDAVAPELRKWFFYRPGVPLDIVRARAAAVYQIAVKLFVKAEREYWKHHDPGDVPDQSMMNDAFEPTNAAFVRASKTRVPAKTRKQAVDYSAARELLEPYLVKGALGQKLGIGDSLDHDVPVLLGTIALREGRFLDAIQILESGGADSRARGVRATAYLALGKRDEAKEVLRGDPRLFPVPTDHGFIAELDGDREAAIAWYVEALDAKLDIWRNYAAYRLKRLQVTPARIKALREEALRAGKIVVASEQDFHAKFAQIADAVRAHEKIETPRKPMTDTEIEALRLPTLRRGTSPLVPVPPSLATILRYDRDFRLFAGALPLFTPGKPTDIDKLVRRDLRIKLPANKPVWNDDPKLPACIGLSNPGDQRVFLYMGTPDESGEYPVARYDDQPEIWLSAASLAHHVLDALSAYVHCTIDFKAKLERAKKRNRQYREVLSKHVNIDALLS